MVSNVLTPLLNVLTPLLNVPTPLLNVLTPLLNVLTPLLMESANGSYFDFMLYEALLAFYADP